MEQRIDIRGKSSKELKEIIVGLKDHNKYLSKCIDNLKQQKLNAKQQVTEIKKTTNKTLNKTISQVKSEERLIAREETRKSVRAKENELREIIRGLESTVTKQKKEIEKLLASEGDLLGRLDELKVITKPDVQKELANKYYLDLVDTWKGKYDSLVLRHKKLQSKKDKVKTIKQKVVVEVERKKTVADIKAERFAKYIEKPLAERVLNLSELSLKVIAFLSESAISNDDISLIIKANILGNFTARSLGAGSRKLVNLESRGLIARSNVGIGTRADYWFLTPDGDKLIKKLMDYISYGKTKL